MKVSNNYISLETAESLILKGYIFRQDLQQTKFVVKRSESSLDELKLNKKNATELKKKLPSLYAQLKIKI